MTIPFTVLGGYLGAGKTTLLNRLLTNADGERLALIINDFGAINIDAALISEQTDEQINLTNGCICCGMSAGFDEAITGLQSRQPPPDRIIVEASGVADVAALAQYGHHPGLTLDGIIVIADAETVRAKARDKYVDKTVIRQLTSADFIVLNKSDLVSADTLNEVRDWLQDLTSETPVVTTSYCQIPNDVLFGLGHRSNVKLEGHPGHETYVTWHFEREAPVSRDAVDAFLATLPAGVLRGKGFFDVGGRLLYQQVGRRTTLEPAEAPGGSRIVLIGLEVELHPEVLDDLAGRFFPDP